MELEVPVPSIVKETVDVEEVQEKKTALSLEVEEAVPPPPSRPDSSMFEVPVTASQPETVLDAEQSSQEHPEVEAEVMIMIQDNDIVEHPLPSMQRSPSVSLPDSQELPSSSIPDETPLPTQVHAAEEPSAADTTHVDMEEDVQVVEASSSPGADIPLQIRSRLPSQQPSRPSRSVSVVQAPEPVPPPTEPEFVVTKVELEDVDMEDVASEVHAETREVTMSTKGPSPQPMLQAISPAELQLPSFTPSTISIRARLTPIAPPPNYNVTLEAPPGVQTDQWRPLFPIPDRGYTLPPLKDLPPEFHRKSKSGKQAKRSREKEREKGSDRGERKEVKEPKEEWQSMGLNKLGVVMRANPIHRKISRTTKCLNTRDWNVCPPFPVLYAWGSSLCGCRSRTLS